MLTRKTRERFLYRLEFRRLKRFYKWNTPHVWIYEYEIHVCIFTNLSAMYFVLLGIFRVPTCFKDSNLKPHTYKMPNNSKQLFTFNYFVYLMTIRLISIDSKMTVWVCLLCRKFLTSWSWNYIKSPKSFQLFVLPQYSFHIITNTQKTLWLYISRRIFIHLPPFNISFAEMVVLLFEHLESNSFFDSTIRFDDKKCKFNAAALLWIELMGRSEYINLFQA